MVLCRPTKICEPALRLASAESRKKGIDFERRPVPVAPEIITQGHSVLVLLRQYGVGSISTLSTDVIEKSMEISCEICLGLLAP